MWYRRRGFGFPFPFMPHFYGMRPFPRREEYLRMLEDYRNELKEELEDVEREIEEMKRG